MQESANKRLYEYENIKGEAHEIKAKNINPYLVDADDMLLYNRSSPICNSPNMAKGSQPTDGGHLLLDENEKTELIKNEPQAEIWIRPFLNAKEFLHGIPRYCLWLKDCPPNILKEMPLVMKRIENVRHMRAASKKAATRALAATPTLFTEDRQPDSEYLLIPSTTSENRVYVPMGYMSPNTICGNLNLSIPNASLYDFGIITSLMHNAWMRAVCGRLESRYRYSAGIVYNNFPWPSKPSEKQKADIAQKAEAIINTRKQYPEATLADLYDPLTMPPPLLKAHQTLDKAVDKTYRKAAFTSEAERVAHLFTLHQQYTSQLCQPKPKRKRK